MTNRGGTEKGQHPTVELLLQRRSRRGGFTDQLVPAKVVKTMLLCGLSAPSSKNAQPWVLHAVPRGENLNLIADDVESSKNGGEFVPRHPITGEPLEWGPTVVESAKVLREVPLAVFFENTGKFSVSRSAVAMAEASHLEDAILGFQIEMLSHGMAMHAVLMAAYDLGLVGVPMGDVLVAEKQIRARLGMAGDLVAVLALGYSDEDPYPKSLRPGTVVYHNLLLVGIWAQARIPAGELLNLQDLRSNNAYI